MSLPYSLLGMMGNVRTKDRKQKEEAEKRIKDLEMQGHFKDEIGKIIMAEYKEALDGKHLLDTMNLMYKILINFIPLY